MLAGSKVLLKECGDTDVVLLQNVHPGLIVEYCSMLCGNHELNDKLDGMNENCPPVGASIVTFPLKPKPHECDKASWVTYAWVGKDVVK